MFIFAEEEDGAEIDPALVDDDEDDDDDEDEEDD